MKVIIFCLLCFFLPLYFNENFESLIEFNTDLAKTLLLRVFSVILLGYWIFGALRKKGNYIFLNKSQVDLPILSWLFISLLATLFSVSPVISLVGGYFRYEGFLSLLNYILLFYFVINFFSKKQAEFIIYALIAGGLLAAAYGICQYLGFDFLHRSYIRIRPESTFGNPAFFAPYLLMCSFLSLGMYFYKKNILFLFLGSFLINVIFLSKTRASMVGLLFGLILFLIFTFGVLIKKFKREFLLAILVFFLNFSFIALNPATSPVGRFLDIFKKEEPPKEESTIQETKQPQDEIFEFKETTPLGEYTARVRLYMWKDCLNIIKDYPIFGVGLDTLDIVYPKYRSKEHVRGAGGPGLRCDRAHNEILDICLSRGILGLIGWLFLYIGFFIFYLKKIKKQSPKVILLAASMICAVFSFILQNQFSFTNPPNSFLHWISLALLVIFLTKESKVLKINKYLVSGLLGLVSLVWIFVYLPVALADLSYHKGCILAELKRPSEARNMFEKAVRIYPYEKRYVARLIKYNLDLTSQNNKEFLYQAKEQAKAMIKRIPHEPAFYNILGCVLGYLENVEKNKSYIEERIKLYTKARELDPTMPDVHYNLALMYTLKGDIDEAISCYKTALFYIPQHTLFLFRLVDLYLEKNKLQEAIDICQAFISYNQGHPQLKDVYLKLSELYHLKKDNKKLRETLHKLIEIDPYNFMALKNLGIIYLKEKKPREAKAFFERALKIQNDSQLEALIKSL